MATKIRKYVCPKCGSDVVYFRDVTQSEDRKVNPVTGIVEKKVVSDYSSLVGAEGVNCAKDCGWLISFTDPNYPPESDIWDELRFPWDSK